MKKIVFFLSLCVLVSYAQAQTYTGFNYGNYNGVVGATFNPANIANSQYKFDFNLFSVNALAGTNAYSFKSKRFLKGDFNDLKDSIDYFKKVDGKDKNMWSNVDILGPSFMVNLGKKGGAFAITTRARVLANADNLRDSIFQVITSGSEPSLFGVPYHQDNFKGDAHSFGEVGLTYARTLWQNENHLLSGGITAKYLVGLASASGRADNVNINIVENASQIKEIKELSGTASVLYSQGIDKFVGDKKDDISWSDVIKDRGVGFDAGITYEWRPKGNTQYFDTYDMDKESHWLTRMRTPYKVKAGLSITDIGKIKYTLTDNSKNYELAATNIDQSLFEIKDGETIDEYIERLKAQASGDGISNILTEKDAVSGYKVSLPTMLHANVDWQAYKHLFVNVNANINMAGKNSFGPHYISNVTVTPRLEYKWFTLYSPVSYNERTKMNWGVGLNFGVFYVGSGSILTGLMKSEMQDIDVHAGMHIPIYKRRAKKPKAEVYTPEEPVQIIKEQPKPVDTDGDGVTDDIDKCPKVAGLAKYQGCPIPDTDGDGINDEEDRCPNEPGTRANYGCPEIKKEVVEKVNYAARGIQFATGSDKLLAVSFPALDDVYNLMMATPALMLTMEGYTDNTGNPLFNQKLSAKRANSVKQYFLSKGVAAERLSAEGYGQASPVAPNTTAAGRAQNRRVELKLHY